MNPHKEYPKINSLWKRDSKRQNRCVVGDWATPEMEALDGATFLWTEKVDGTNIRLGYRANGTFRGNEHAFIFGRTDNAQIPPKLLNALVEIQRAAPYEEVFPDLSPDSSVTLYGEGYGAGIQKGGGNYRLDNSFVLFDVKVGDWWLSWENVKDVARKLDIAHVPAVTFGTLMEAWENVDKMSSGWSGVEKPEGMVGRPLATLFDARGHRILAKVKIKDKEEAVDG